MAFDCLVKFLDHQTAQRADQHSAHKHGIIGSTADNTDAGDCAHDRAASAADHSTACISDQNRKHIGQHGADHCGQLLIGKPAGCNEKCCDKSPCDECADVGHYHSAEEPSEGLNFLFHHYLLYVKNSYPERSWPDRPAASFVPSMCPLYGCPNAICNEYKMDFVTIKSDKRFACLGHFSPLQNNVNFDHVL